MQKIKIGLLPLYIKLYDDTSPSLRDRLDKFYEKMACALELKNFEVMRTPFCRLENEFKDAVKSYETACADCIVTLNMAYSPSLESAEALVNTKLPIVVMDTTETYEFGPDQDPDEIDYNHGIHGVMDLCNILKRGGKIYAIAAGHYIHSSVVEDTAKFVRAAAAVKYVRGSKVGVFGGCFHGMGDFQVTPAELKEKFDIEMIEADYDEIRKITASITEDEIAAEIKADQAQFDFPEKIKDEIYKLNTRACLAIRKWIQKEQLDAFSVNFFKACPAYGIDAMPFLEICKAMERGIGYAGEGDAMDAAFTGALIKAFGDVSFVEIFCPDWKNDRIFISHMGEMNYRVADRKPEIRMRTSNYADSIMPMAGYAGFKPGMASYINVYRDETGYCMLAAEVEMLKFENDENFSAAIRGWFKPNTSTADFLKKLSLHGATHHSMLVYDIKPEQILFFGKLLNMKVFEI